MQWNNLDYCGHETALETWKCNLAQGFFHHVRHTPDAPALVLDGEILSYQRLGTIAAAVANQLKTWCLGPGSRVGILASRSIPAYAGVLGACWAGCTYVPLNPANPPARLRGLLKHADVQALVVDSRGSEQWQALGTATDRVMGPSLESLAIPDPLPQPEPVPDTELAYLMFTSGTTGTPKGVMVTHANISTFLAIMQHRYQLSPADRVSQFFELTFDLSVFDLFMSWNAGASLWVVPESARMAPTGFIRGNELTAWFSVPSSMVMMDRFRQLKPGALPSLRLALFCGEPLPADPLQRWLDATSNAVTENLYGPTEATLACLLQPCSKPVVVTPERDTVAIGTPYPGTHAAILNHDGSFSSPGVPGELVLAGAQIAAGYWRDPGLTSEHFVELKSIDGSTRRWYRTGDLAYKDEKGRFHHLGRMDNQIKIFGHRVELEDIDAHLRAVCEVETAATVAWPVEHGSAQGIVGFVSGTKLDQAEIRKRMKARVPDYMVPRRIQFLDALPLTVNGKLDRRALLEHM